MKTTEFREDINALRAWAVIAVVFFHFGIPGFDGGFIGVDIFFVISGFLMTGIVIKGLERDEFTIALFYLARARRILPALVALCAILMTLGWLFLLPPDYKLISSHTVYSLAFLSNFEYWLEAGYFDSASHEKWLLHTWSLSIEWQFYLILPIILRILWKLKPNNKTQIWIICTLLLTSLGISIFTTQGSPSTSFFLLHTRAWELLSGSLVFLISRRGPLPNHHAYWMEKAGFTLILVSILIFDQESLWPSWNAIMPVLATAMIIMAKQANALAKSKILQWIGDRSYSIYLWHWPIYVALVYTETNSNSTYIAVGLLTALGAGHLSYVFIEKQSGRILEKTRPNFSTTVLVIMTSLVVLPAMATWKTNGIKDRFLEEIEIAAAEANNSNPRRKECHPSLGQSFPSCVYGGEKVRVIALGDSHASAIVTGFEQAEPGGRAGIAQWSYSGCPFVPGMKKTPFAQNKSGGENYKCAEFINRVESELKTLPNSIPVVIFGRYSAAAFGENELNIKKQPSVYFSKIYSKSNSEFIHEFSLHITQSACNIAKQRTVYMVRPIPEMGFNVPKTLSRRMAFGLDSDMSISRADYATRNSWVWAAQDAARDQCGIIILDPTQHLCNEERCFGSRNFRPIYHDDNHLSEFGNKIITPIFLPVFANLKSKQ